MPILNKCDILVPENGLTVDVNTQLEMLNQVRRESHQTLRKLPAPFSSPATHTYLRLELISPEGKLDMFWGLLKEGKCSFLVLVTNTSQNDVRIELLAPTSGINPRFVGPRQPVCADTTDLGTVLHLTMKPKPDISGNYPHRIAN